MTGSFVLSGRLKESGKEASNDSLMKRQVEKYWYEMFVGSVQELQGLLPSVLDSWPMARQCQSKRSRWASHVREILEAFCIMNKAKFRICLEAGDVRERCGCLMQSG